MRIALANSFYTPDILGGAEVAVQNLAETLQEKGWRAEVFCIGKVSGTDESRGVTIHRGRLRNPIWGDFSSNESRTIIRMVGHIRQLYCPRVAQDTAKAIKSFDPDIIHLHNINGFSAAIYRYLEKHCGDVPTVQTLHDYWHACIRNTLLNSKKEVCQNRPAPCVMRSKVLQMSIKYVSRFVSPSQFLADYYVSSGIIAKEKMSVIPNGVTGLDCDLESLEERRGRCKNRDTVRVLYIGQLEQHKGVRTLLQAARKLQGHSIEITIAGVGSMTEAVQADRSVVYLGLVRGAAKASAFLDADILVVPSEWYENNPLAILEGLKYGLAIVGTSIGGIPELVIDGENGRLIVPKSPNELARVLIDVASDQQTLARYQVRSLEISKRYSIASMAEQYIGLYEKLLH